MKSCRCSSVIEGLLNKEVALGLIPSTESKKKEREGIEGEKEKINLGLENYILGSLCCLQDTGVLVLILWFCKHSSHTKAPRSSTPRAWNGPSIENDSASLLSEFLLDIFSLFLKNSMFLASSPMVWS